MKFGLLHSLPAQGLETQMSTTPGFTELWQGIVDCGLFTVYIWRFLSIHGMNCRIVSKWEHGCVCVVLQLTGSFPCDVSVLDLHDALPWEPSDESPTCCLKSLGVYTDGAVLCCRQALPIYLHACKLGKLYLPPRKFCTVRKLLENLFVQNFLSKMQKFGPKPQF